MVERCRMWMIGGMLGGVLGVGAGGCDDSAAPPPPPPLTDPAAESPHDAASSNGSAAPTTQDLVSGPRKSVQAGFFPMTLRVPESWTLTTLDNGQVLLQGRSPTGDIAVQIAHRPFTTAEKIDILVMGAKKEMADKPDEIRKAELRDKGAIKIFERQSVGTRSVPGISNGGSTPTDLGPLFRWTTTYFIPSGKQFDSYDLSFVALPVKQYEADREFLQEIVESVEFTGQ